MRDVKLFFFVLLSNVFLVISTLYASESANWQVMQLPEHAVELRLSLDESAKILAGMPVAGVAMRDLDSLKSFWRQWQSDKVWRYEKDYDANAYMTSNKIAAHLHNMESFGKQFSSQVPSKQVIYPFGGPDAIYPTLLFDFDSMLSLGLEDAGELNIKFYQHNGQFYVTLGSLAYELGNAIESICYSLASLPMRSYFVTDSMKTEMRGGVVVAYLVQLATLGAVIKEASIGNEELSIIYSTNLSGSEKKISYMKHDLSSMARIKEIENILGDKDSILFLKAAQYILYPSSEHEIYSTTFSPFIDWIRNRGSIKHIVQAVSGLPWMFFKTGRWQTQFYGAYLPLAMHPLFKGTPHGMGVDMGLMCDFYHTLNSEQELSMEDSQCKEWICSNNSFVKANYPEAMSQSEKVPDCCWSGALKFGIDYPCFLSRRCSASSGALWNAKNFPEAGDHVSFLMVAKRY